MPVTLTPLHLVRAGAGPDAVRLQVRGFGLVLGTLGVFFVSGAFDRVLLRRFRSRRVRVFFLGIPFGWRSARLAPETKLAVPDVERSAAPRLPAVAPAPSLALSLTITAPEP
jgi:hypothetical protein